jgi:hypothetical protein
MLGCPEKIGAFAAAFILAATLAGCGSASGVGDHGHIDCNVVKLQSEAGRQPGEIAAALGVSEADVQSCHAPGPEAVEQGGGEGGPPPGKASEYGLPEGMEGAAGGGGGQGAGGGQGGAGGGGSGGEGGGQGGQSQ